MTLRQKEVFSKGGSVAFHRRVEPAGSHPCVAFDRAIHQVKRTRDQSAVDDHAVFRHRRIIGLAGEQEAQDVGVDVALRVRVGAIPVLRCCGAGVP